jgi:hypothetical protein
MSGRRRFLVIIPRNDGGVEAYPMKEWLRQHPEHIPPGLDATANNAWSLRDGLKRKGWSVTETETEVRLSPPGSAPLPSIIDEVLGTGNADEDDAGQAAAFALEYQLRDFIAQNLSTIRVGGKRLKLYVDATGRDGIEFPSATGPIDILAIDDDGAFVVFELKRANSPDRAIGQLARYMGWVSQTIGKGHQVRGVIVAKSISDNLRYAASVVPDVSLFEYRVEFHLKQANAETAGG